MSTNHLTIFGLCSRCTARVVCHLVRQGTWGTDMVYDTDATILMTTTTEAAEIVHAALEELGVEHDHEHVVAF